MEMAPKKEDAKKTDPVAKATKMVNRSLVSVHRVGNLTGLNASQIDKIEAALSKQLQTSISRLRNPGKKEQGFTL
jgi:hypothetical protein